IVYSFVANTTCSALPMRSNPRAKPPNTNPRWCIMPFTRAQIALSGGLGTASVLAFEAFL
ncbi:MAG TPA: hypothetical protein VL793_10440, partial [Patescibacteria group bacterium]|nr:hypothetical protein [Patescibacteria group bacterium]